MIATLLILILLALIAPALCIALVELAIRAALWLGVILVIFMIVAPLLAS